MYLPKQQKSVWSVLALDKKRSFIQWLAFILQNANFVGFFTGKIYQGSSKAVCVPGLHCYSCPGSVGACPIGSLQSFLASRPIRIPYYVVGLILFFGTVLGRAVCGFLCPMGLLQELVHKIPFPKKVNRFKGDKLLRFLKYPILVLMIVLPMFYALTPFFCKYICPSGTIAGILLALRNEGIRPLLGGLFTWKFTVLLSIVLLCVVIWRPFCKYLCPLGAIYGFFNKFALYHAELDSSKCVSCGKCAKVCRMCIDPSKTPNSMECIRCGDCVRACSKDALNMGFLKLKK